MKKLLTLILLLATTAIAIADVETDKNITRILKDTNKYLASDARASTEWDAEDQAMANLRSLVSDFLIKIDSNMSLAQAQEKFHTIVVKISDKRYRVLAYVLKTDLGADPYMSEPLKENPRKQPEPAPNNDDNYDDFDRDYIEEPHNYGNNNSSTLAEIKRQGTLNELRSCLENLRKSNSVTGAAAFPLSSATDFYVVVVDGNIVKIMLHYVNGRYYETETNKEIDINKYSNYSGYWFTLPK